MNLTRWEPFKETEELLRDYLPEFRGRFVRHGGTSRNAAFDWSPVADVSESEREYLVKAELPGVKPEDVKVTLEEGVLSIRGERRQEQEQKDEKMHRVERFYGSFARSFTLPDGVDAANIRAETKEGVLVVHVPKLKIEKSKPIEIKVQ